MTLAFARVLIAFERVLDMKESLCLTCGAAFKEKRVGRKRFCSDSCRASSWRLGVSATPCFYCGCPAGTTDHVPPRSVRPFLIVEKLDKKYPFIEVDACSECNALLGARAIWTTKKRKRFIKLALRMRYKKFLRQPSWSEDELNPLGRTLRSYVEMRAIARTVLVQRLQW